MITLNMMKRSVAQELIKIDDVAFFQFEQFSKTVLHEQRKSQSQIDININFHRKMQFLLP